MRDAAERLLAQAERAPVLAQGLVEAAAFLQHDAEVDQRVDPVRLQLQYTLEGGRGAWQVVAILAHERKAEPRVGVVRHHGRGTFEPLRRGREIVARRRGLGRHEERGNVVGAHLQAQRGVALRVGGLAGLQVEHGEQLVHRRMRRVAGDGLVADDAGALALARVDEADRDVQQFGDGRSGHAGNVASDSPGAVRKEGRAYIQGWVGPATLFDGSPFGSIEKENDMDATLPAVSCAAAELDASWEQAWRDLGLAPAPGLRDELLRRWSQAHRKYHTLQHLAECLALFADVRPIAERPGEVALALWFHDAIYETNRHDNEAESAAWARRALVEAHAARDVVDRVGALVMATRHSEVPDTPDAALLVDIDLAILGAVPARFDEYERQIRDEYGQVPDALFREKRREILQAFADRRPIYATELVRDRLEAAAQTNLRRSLGELDSSQ